MRLLNWLGGLTSAVQRGAPREMRLRKAVRRRLPNAAVVETLEDRTLLTAFVVNTTTDVINAGDGVISLREAITAANTNAASGNAAAGSADGDRITFAAALAGSTITLNAGLGELAITDDLVVDASTIATGANVLPITISGGDMTRVFSVQASVNSGGGDGTNEAVTFRNLKITDGSAAGDGGGIRVINGNLSLSVTQVSDSVATGSGGGIFSAGRLAIFASQIIDNVAAGAAATQGGGGIFNALGQVLISGMTGIARNDATGASGSGGGIFSSGGSLVADGTTISFNTAARAGGGIEARAGAALSAATPYTVLLTGVGLNFNIAGPNGAVSPANPGNGGGFHGTGAGNVRVLGSQVMGNIAAREGGGLWNSAGATMTVSGTTVMGNIASRGFDDGANTNQGGGIFNNGGFLTVSDAVVSDNVASTFGARLGLGGGVANATGGTVNLTGAVITRNTAGIGGGVFNAAASAVQTFVVNLNPVGDSDVSGIALLTLNTGDTDGVAPGVQTSLTVTIVATGLEPGRVHPQYIQGRFTENLDDPGADDGEFFEGAGGTAVDSNARTFEEGEFDVDRDFDGFIDFDEAIRGFGPAILPLTSPQTPPPPSGVAPVDTANLADFPSTPDGNLNFTETYTFDLTDPDDARQYNNLLPLDFRNIVLYGRTTGEDINGDGQPEGFVADAPVAAGDIRLSAGGVTVLGGSITENTATQSGGGVANRGRMTVNSCDVTDNVAQGNAASQGGGGMFNDGGRLDVVATFVNSNDATGTSGSGGGILNGVDGRLTVVASTIDGNRATRAGGGIEDNAGAALDPANTVAVIGTFLRNNITGPSGQANPANPGNGGAFHGTGAGEITLFRDFISGNVAANEGGGVWIAATGTLEMDASYLFGNVATTDGGGLFLLGAAEVEDSTIVFNIAANDDGGGIFANNSLTLVNSTVGQNRAGGAGGGVFVNADAGTAGAVVIANSTIILNRADEDGAMAGTGGGLFVGAGESVTLHNSVVAQNEFGAAGGTTFSDVSGTVAGTGSFNFVGVDNGLTGITDGSQGNRIGTAAAPLNPLLGALADNGGPTLTYAPTVGSPLIDQGRDVLGTERDQRGFDRPIDFQDIVDALNGDGSDIGAVEVQLGAQV